VRGEGLGYRGNQMSVRHWARGALAALMVAGGLTAGALSVGAPPASADTDTDTTTANVSVSSLITLTDLTGSFTLTGAPGDTVTTSSPVTMTVKTNNFAGYSVTVEPAGTTMDPAIAGNTDTIPTTSLLVRGPSQSGSFTALTPGTPLEVRRKTSASAEAGDSVSNDYRMTIPFVRPDTYSATLNYVASTL
jgi:hypothetical protein